ncbi:MAG TPA: hypothetical protein H9988_02265 [Candidatus Acutalibacter stercoravium]|nr:hypothetical protein [Candidatus Acutalibacter stercoravium]
MAKKNTKQRRKEAKGESAQSFLPVRDIRNGLVETTDGRYLKILKIEPINFALRSSEEQFNIISSFASWLKISPVRLQLKAITRRADSDRHIALVREELAREENPQCRALGEDYLRLIQDVDSREALTRRFFLIFQYEAVGRDDGDYSKIYSALQGAEQTARAYFLQCGNGIVQPANPDEATAEILYQIFNRRSCVKEPFQTRVDRVVLDTMAAQGLTLGLDPVSEIPVVEFLAPRGIDFTHYNHIIMDGRYYSILYIRGNGYPSRVRAGWMSALINAGEGIDIDIHLRRENRSRAIDKVAQRIRLNRTKLKGMQDTSTDYEELANSIQAGYFIKNGIANYNEDLFYLSVFITVSAQTYEELLWRKRQMTDMLKSMDMQVSECHFQQEAALRSVLPFLSIDSGLEKKSRRNVLTSGAASTYGRAIINNSKNKIILNLEPDEARTVQETLKLTRSEVRAITQFERGEALICSNSNKVPVVIKASQTELEMITTDRAELEALLLERKKTRKEGKARKIEKTQREEVETSPSSLPDYTSDSKKGRT